MIHPEIKDYASAIHRLTCHHNHSDQCGWFYGEIQRSYNYEEAEKLIPVLKAAGINVEDIHTLADILKPYTKEWRKYDS
jgi:hypothetical protein